ncbi:MAG: glycosyltransferase family 4 protein [Bacteroides sp.]|nr:glycosyltransferase family 4 protein [Bacteroides sp.]
MGRINSILVVTPNYPFKDNQVYPFVKNLCEQFIKMGYIVTVISPQSITSLILHRKKMRPKRWIDIISDKKLIVYQPYYITFPFKYHDINNILIRLCLKLFFKKNKMKQDVVYSHFWNSAYAVMPFAKKNNIPLFVATGESEIKALFSTKFGLKRLKEYVKGVICVSSKNRDESIALGLTTYNKCDVFPNGVNAELFYKRDRMKCRKLLGFPQDAFIVAYVGWFIDRKGSLRVSEAINRVGNVNSFFIGKGEQEPKCNGILFKGSLLHEDIPVYLCAADIFVLPTLHEGCCNAVIEAMACGLPIVSSNLPFNWDVLDTSNSIMIDPNNIEEIADAIRTLRDDVHKRKALADGAIVKARSLTIEQRAESILKFMENRM